MALKRKSFGLVQGFPAALTRESPLPRAGEGASPLKPRLHRHPISPRVTRLPNNQPGAAGRRGKEIEVPCVEGVADQAEDFTALWRPIAGAQIGQHIALDILDGGRRRA
jgi:hypothetical protein